MKKYYEDFITYSLQQCTEYEYEDKHKVKRHNQATRRLLKLKNEISESEWLEIFPLLLLYDDERIQLNVASFCLKFKVHQEQAITILLRLINHSDDRIISFNAKMILQLSMQK